MFSETTSTGMVKMMFIWSTINQFFPKIFTDCINNQLKRLVAYFRPEAQITFYEASTKSNWFQRSKAYTAIESYLSSRPTTILSKHLNGDTADNKSTKSLVFSLVDHHEVDDEFEGVRVRWISGKEAPNRKTISFSDDRGAEKRFFTVAFHPKHRDLVMNKYLRYIMQEGENVQKRLRQRNLYSNNPSSQWNNYRGALWSEIKFEHPATFENLAMDPAKKDEIIEDLTTFSKARDYYMKIGKSWKRGYLLYGPPGTGKSTMIACIANLLGYDVYDIELTSVKTNTELRTLLINTKGKAVIVIEDIDCSLPITGKREEEDSSSSDESDDDEDKEETKKDLNKKSKKESDKESKTKSEVTLSGLLNFIDGLWSPCEGERLIIFTTNHIDKLDPALIRAGRMDMHIEMSYCTFEAFKIFARNYMNMESHPLFDRIEQLLGEVKITPADVAEKLLPKSGNEVPEKRLKAVIQAMEKTKEAQKLMVEEKEQNDKAAGGFEMANKEHG